MSFILKQYTYITKIIQLASLRMRLSFSSISLPRMHQFEKSAIAISKRRSWGFQNTPNLQNSDYFEPSYCNWKKIEVFQNWFDWLICKSSFCATSFFAVFLVNTHQKDDLWRCFGIVRTSSWWWALRFSKSIHPGLRNWQKRKSSSYWRQLYFNICKVGDRQGVMMSQILYSTEECKAVKPWTESVSWT